MLNDRGYVIEKGDLEKEFVEFKEEYEQYNDRNHFQIFAEHRDNQSNTLLVFFPEDEKLGTTPIRKMMTIMHENSVLNAIIVIRSEISAFAKRIVEKANAAFRMETFKQSELMINITKHELVPTHLVLTNAQKKDLLKKYALKEGQLPRIQKVDAVARYYGLDRGQVVKIVRKSETAGRYVTYRIVV